MKTTLHGILVALVTPMKANSQIDFHTYAKHVEAMIGAGVHGLIPLGSTGEFYALSPEERRDVIQATLEAADGRVPVVAGANASSTREVVAFSREAEELGCAGVMLAPPYYSLPQPEELHAHYRAVNDAIGIPIMLYNYPGRTGVDMTPEFIERLAETAAHPLRQGKHRRDRPHQHAPAAVWRPVGRLLRRRYRGLREPGFGRGGLGGRRGQCRAALARRACIG
jgi:dihydrodipicolinate synthase/N-acetylneuraminate lyase